MISRLFKASISGLSMTLMFLFGFAVIGQLIHLCNERYMMGKLPRATEWLVEIAPYHFWQGATCLLLLLVGFSWLGYQANESSSVIIHRVSIIAVFVFVCVASFPFLEGSSLIEHPSFMWENLILPTLSTIPVLLAILQHRRSS